MNGQQLVAYKQGATNCQTAFSDGKCIYTGKPVEEYKTEGFEIMTLDAACDLIEKAQEARYHAPWEEITEEEYRDALECLPPMRWNKVSGIEFFQMSERYEGEWTATYANIGERYFKALRQTFDKYVDLAAELRGQTDLKL